MAAKNRQQTVAVIDDLYANPTAYEFHQAVRILTAVKDDPLAAHHHEGAKTAAPLWFSARIQLAYPSSDIYAIQSLEGGQIHMEVNFMGLAGLTGPLPLAYTERFMERERAHDKAPRAFLDLFNNRLIRLLHQIRTHQWPTLSPCPPEQSSLAFPIKSFAGLNGRFIENRLSVPDSSLYAFAGLLWHHPRSAAGLQRILKVHFNVQVSIAPCQGGWRPINEQLLTKLGGNIARLGWGASVGTRFWDQSRALKLTLGPLDLDHYMAFLPGESAFTSLAELSRFYLGYQTRIIAELVLRREDVPATQLSRHARLGWTSWLLRDRAREDGRAQIRVLDDVEQAYS
ncbi:MAG: type VI secretion system baseplate subunit TssG [Holosporales bacterium]